MEDIINYILGYLRPVTWASSIKENPHNKNVIYQYMHKQEELYGFELIPNVEWLLENEEAYIQALKNNKRCGDSGEYQ